MRLGIGIGIGMHHGGGAIGAFIARNSKYARWRLDDASRLYQTDDTSSAVTAAAQAVGRIEAASGSASPLAWTQATAGARGTWATTGITCDGGDYWDGGTNNADLHRNIQSSVLGLSATATSLAAVVDLISWSTDTGTVHRIRVSVMTTGAVRLQLRRTDAETTTTFTSATGIVTAGARFTLVLVINWATGAVNLHINGVDVSSSWTLAGPGTTSNTASARIRLATGLMASPSLLLPGTLHRQIFTAANATPVIPTASEIAAMHAELAE